MADPVLKEAMAEIMGILKKHDIAGQVTLVSPTHTEFRYRIDPKWACTTVEAQGDGYMAVRFRAKKSEIPDMKERHKIVERTMHMLLSIRDLSGKNFLMFDGLEKQLKPHIDFDHKPFSDFEPHREG
jgi:hypothetical protein